MAPCTRQQDRQALGTNQTNVLPWDALWQDKVKIVSITYDQRVASNWIKYYQSLEKPDV